jgi:epoxyqueuosine reductase QueG
MNRDIEILLKNSGASLIGFADISEQYAHVDMSLPQTEDSSHGAFKIPKYPGGVSIALAIPTHIISGISDAPTQDYYEAYYLLNEKLDALAGLCVQYIESKGYNAYAQTVLVTKEFGIFRTVMPHKTVAVRAGLGFIGKSALFVTKEYGSAVRLTSVLTDAPLKYGSPIVEAPCASCQICANSCPADAISGKVWTAQTDRDDFFNAMACRKKAREISATVLNKTITLCGKCIEVCPYTKRYTTCGK